MVTRSYDGIAKVRANLANFQARRQAIEQDQELSKMGKDKKLQVLDAEIGQYRTKAHNDLDLELRLLKQDNRKLQEADRLANEKAAKGWDFNQLNYQATAARSAVWKATNIGELISAYDQVQKGADSHAKRAWAELVGGFALDRFQITVETNQLARRAERDLKKLTTTPDLEQVQAESDALGKRIEDFVNTTQAAGQFFSPPGGWSSSNEFSNLLDDIKVSQKVNPEDPARFITTSYEFTDSAPSDSAGDSAGAAAAGE